MTKIKVLLKNYAACLSFGFNLLENKGMELKIAFVGNDPKYFSRLKNEFSNTYPDWQITFFDFALDQGASFKRLFVSLYQLEAQIIYIDYSEYIDQGVGLAKLLNQNAQTRLASVVGLFSLEKLPSLHRSINASVRLNFIKCIEIEDVIYHPLALLDVDLPSDLNYFQSGELNPFEIAQPLRIGFIGDNHFHVETNSFLPVGEILEVDHHPLEDIMNSKKVFVQSFHDHDLYFNKRFAYELEFIYIDNDFFVSTNERWKLYKQLKKNPALLENMSRFEQIEIREDMKKRKKLFKPIRKKIDQWIKRHIEGKEPKKLKILVFDETLELFRELDKPQQDFLYSINFQTDYKVAHYVVKRFMPHLIAFDFGDEKNQIEDFEKMILDIRSIANYEPFILAFNLCQEKFKMVNSLNYEHCLTYPHSIDTKLLIEMAKKLDQKLHITQEHKKVFVRSTDEFANIVIKRTVDVISMSEFDIYFKSELEIPLWTVFKVTNPIGMLMTVIPHRKEGGLHQGPGVYRALINGVGELDRSQLRRMINASLDEDH